jgi:AIG2-like family
MAKIKVPRQRIQKGRTKFRPYKALMWSYGSNCNIEQMKRRCPNASPVDKLLITGTSLVFRGVADVVIKPGVAAPGALWRITRECEQSLDYYEGIGTGLYMKRFFTINIDGRQEEVLFYQMKMSSGVMPPTETYVETIARGYHDFDIDLDYLNRALMESWNDKEVTPVLKERHVKRGKPKLAREVNEFFLTEDDLREAGAV